MLFKIFIILRIVFINFYGCYVQIIFYHAFFRCKKDKNELFFIKNGLFYYLFRKDVLF